MRLPESERSCIILLQCTIEIYLCYRQVVEKLSCKSGFPQKYVADKPLYTSFNSVRVCRYWSSLISNIFYLSTNLAVTCNIRGNPINARNSQWLAWLPFYESKMKITLKSLPPNSYSAWHFANGDLLFNFCLWLDFKPTYSIFVSIVIYSYIRLSFVATNAVCFINALFSCSIFQAEEQCGVINSTKQMFPSLAGEQIHAHGRMAVITCNYDSKVTTGDWGIKFVYFQRLPVAVT